MTGPITHGQVVETIIKENYADKSNSAKVFRSSCKAWCIAANSSLDSPAEDTLGDTHPLKLAAYLDLLDRTRPDESNAGKNVRTAAKAMAIAYRGMLASQELPADFNDAFKAALDAKGLKPADVNRRVKNQFFDKERPNWYGAQIWGWYDGTGAPGRSWKGDSRLLLQRCEVILELLPNTLVSRAYPVVHPVLVGTFEEIPYRQARSSQWNFKYAIHTLPKRIATNYRCYAEWRRKPAHLVDGAVIVVTPWSQWTSQATERLHRECLKRFFGWLCLPAPTKPLSELSEQERWSHGKGMQVEELRMAHLLNVTLLWEFIEFQQGRQHNKEYSLTQLQLLHHVNSYVSMPYSFLTCHPELATEFGLEPPATKAAWTIKMDEIHESILKLIRGVKKALDGRQRHPDEPLKHLLNQEEPYQLFMEMVDRIEGSPPLKANKQRRAIWSRDVALFRMQSEDPLRVANIVDLKLDRHLKRNKESGRWEISIPKSELKNYYSGHATDISRTYSIEASEAIDRYMAEGRPNLVGATESDWVFLGAASGSRACPESAARSGYKLSTDSVDELVRKYLKKYFGADQGTHIFRHIIATSILKSDPAAIDVAAAVLNNSPHTIARAYDHLTQADSLRRGDKWFNQQRRRKNGDAPEE